MWSGHRGEPRPQQGSSAAQGRCDRRIEDDLLEPVCAGVAALGAHELHVVVVSGSPNMVPSFPKRSWSEPPTGKSTRSR
jgi:hypothetical protein